MEFKINYDGNYYDSFLVSGNTINEIKEIVKSELEKRDWKPNHCTSEQIDGFDVIEYESDCNYCSRYDENSEIKCNVIKVFGLKTVLLCAWKEPK